MSKFRKLSPTANNFELSSDYVVKHTNSRVCKTIFNAQQKCEEQYNRTTGSEVALNCTTGCCRMILTITSVGVAG